MNTVEIRLELPKALSRHEVDQARSAALEGAVLHLYGHGTISGRKAAELLGWDYYDFLEHASRKGIAVAQTYEPAAATAAEKKLRRVRSPKP